MYEDHWYASAQEVPAVQQVRQPAKQVARNTHFPAAEKTAASTQVNGILKTVPPKSIVHEPPKADVIVRAKSFKDLRPWREIGGQLEREKSSFSPTSLQNVTNEGDIAVWFEGFENDLQVANDDDYHMFQEILQSHIYTCNRLLSETRDTITLLDELADGFEVVREQTSAFQHACEELLTEQRRLTKLADELSINLEPFSALEAITRRLNAPGSDLVLKSDFKEMLIKLDTCLAYVQKHPKFKDAEFYQSRYRQCLTRALTLVKVYFTAQVRDIANDVGKRIATKGVNDTTQAALLYAKFRVGAPHLRELADEIEKRCGHEEYLSLMNECYNCFTGIRQKLLLPIITKKMADFAASKDLLSFARSSISYAKSICLDEYDLFYSYFSSGENHLYDFLESLCEPLYDHLRPRIIHEIQLVKLCELCSLLQTRYMRDPDDPDGDTYDRSQLDFGQLIQSPLQDAQTRVVFRSQAVIKDEIENYIPKPDDLDYPAKNQTITQLRTPVSPLMETPLSPIDDSRNGFDTEAVFHGWYPTLRKSIWLLSRIYRLVNSTVFDDLAHQVVHVCISSLLKATDLIKIQKTQADSQLFLLKHLLLLKEQIVAFDIEFVQPDVDIDFSSVTNTFWEIREKGSLFNPNNLLKLMQNGLPRVVENMLDAKVELDGRLRTIINEFTAVWASKITETIVESSGQAPEAANHLKEVRIMAESTVPELRLKLGEYITDVRTRETLVGAVQELVIESYESFYDRADKISLGREELWEVDDFVIWTNNVFKGADTLQSENGSDRSGRESPEGSISSM